MNAQDLLVRLCRGVLLGGTDEPLPRDIDAELLTQTVKLSRTHDLAHLIAAPLISSSAVKSDGALGNLLSSAEELAFYRHKRMQTACRQICDVLTAARIEHIPLKGAVLKEYYPEPWHRQSGDVDVLVRESDLDSAIEALRSVGYTTDGKHDYHDVSLFSPAGVNLELHFNLKENNPKTDKTLDEAWNYARRTSNGDFTMRLSDEFFVLHLVSHAAHHFVNGGCGLKPFFDLYFFGKQADINEKELRSLLRSASLEKFYDSATALTRVIVGDAEHTPLTEAMLAHVVTNEICGGVNKSYAVAQSQSGRGKYLLSRIFMPYSLLKIRYPILVSHPYLLPIYEVVRWVQLATNRSDRARVKNELDSTAAMTEQNMNAVLDFLSSVGLG